MAFDKFLIAPINSGLDTSLRPWLIPDDSFESLENAYVFRGRVRKRFGGILMSSTGEVTNLDQLTSRLRINMGPTDGSGNLSGTAPGVTLNPGRIGQLFSIGSQLYTVNVAGTPAVMLRSSGSATTYTFNTNTGDFVFAGATAATDVYYYPSLPVMGFQRFGFDKISNLPTYAFDTRFAYVFNTVTAWQRSGTGVTPIWHGTDTNLFWSAIFRNPTLVNAALMFVTNFYAVNPTGAISANDDPIWYLNSNSLAWTAFTPTVLTAGNKVLTARIIVAFKNRLIFLNTIEVNAAGTGNVSFPFRCRFSAKDDAISANTFLESTQVGAKGGGVLDLQTMETIITAEFIKDRLIVYCERSTWELAYQGNSVLPFVWQQLNTELGSESTFSVVAFDKYVLAMATVGVHSCNGSNVDRIDNQIPDKVFQIKDRASSVERIFGIRDYFNELVYWAYPQDNEDTGSQFNNKILQYNYRNNTWAVLDDSITAFGYFEQALSVTWQNTSLTWEAYVGTWNEGTEQDQALQVLAGNQEGFVFIVRSDVARNASVLQLTNATIVAATKVVTLTIINHNLMVGDYIAIEQALGATNLNTEIMQVDSIVSANIVTCIVSFSTLPSTYLGRGVVTRISNMNIVSKQWNPYDKDASNIFLGKIDFAVERTTNGEVTVDYFPSASKISMLQAASATNSIMGTGVLETKPYNANIYPFEQYQDRLWHSVYFQTTGTCIQIRVYMNDTQMRTKAITWSDFEIGGIILNTSRITRLQ